MTIRTPTTFVVGAGASCAWGLPSGKDLKKKITELEPRHDVYQFVLSALHRHSIGPAEVNRFRDDLKQHPEDSVDSLLEKQRSRPVTLRIGKTLMAGTIAESLLKAKGKLPESRDWLCHLVKRMLYGVRDCADFIARNAKVQIVTFNFDRMIEKEICELIHSSSMTGDLDVAINSIPVVHVHGVKDKRNKRHVGSIRPAFDRFPGRITASYNAFYVNLAARTAQVCRFFSGRPEKISVVGGSNGEKGTHLSCASIGGEVSEARGSRQRLVTIKVSHSNNNVVFLV